MGKYDGLYSFIISDQYFDYQAKHMFVPFLLYQIGQVGSGQNV